jgi:hypothetical protein
MYINWYKVHLNDADNLVETARRLDRGLRALGHEACLAEDDEGHEFLAVCVDGPSPGEVLERLLRQTGDSAQALPWGGWRITHRFRAA